MEEEWDAHRATLRNLYLEKDEPLEAIMAHMKEHHNFDKSKYQYERQFKDWKFRKNRSKADWKFVRDRIEKRKAEGLESEVFFNGTLVPSKKIRKELSRHFPPTFQPQRASAARLQTPEGISIHTPGPTDLICIQTDNLPWYQFQKFVQSQEAYFQSFYIDDRYSQELLGPQTRACSPSIPLDFESLLSCIPEQTSVARLIVDIPSNTLCSLLQGLVATKVQTDNFQTGTSILPHLQATIVEKYNGELMATFQSIIEPGNASALPHFLNLAVYLLSNNLMHEWQVDQFLGWFTENNHRVLLSSLLSTKIPTIEAIAQTLFQSAFRIGDAYLIKLILDADTKINLCSPLSTFGHTPLEKAVIWGNTELARIILVSDIHKDMADCKSRLRALRIALERYDAIMVQMLLNNGANVKVLASRSGDTLQRMVRYGSIKAVEILLQAGANTNAPASSLYGTPMQEAVRKNDIAIIQLLLDFGAEVNARAYWDSRTVIQEAVNWGNAAAVKLLLAAGADVKKLGFKRDGSWAFESKNPVKDPELIRLLRDAGADETILAAGSLCQASISEAVRNNDVKAVQRFLGTGLDINTKSDTKISLLKLAVENGHTEVVRVLLAAGADVNTTRHNRYKEMNAISSAIEIALELQLVEHERHLLQQRSNRCASREDQQRELNLKQNIQQTNLSLPAKSLANLLQIIELLLKAGACVDEYALYDAFEFAQLLQKKIEHKDLQYTRYPDRLTPLQATALMTWKGHGLELAYLLLHAGADINAPAVERNGRTALQAAATGGNIPLVELLLSKGASVNAPACCDGGRTALQAAAEVHDLEMVQLLLNSGAEVNAPKSCERGLSALQAAVEASKWQEDISLVQLLLKAGADINGPPEDSWPGRWLGSLNHTCYDDGRYTPIQGAAEGSNKKLIQLLLKRGANVNSPAQYNEGRTPLQAAAAAPYGNTEIIEMLLKAGADVNAPAAHDRGVTALQGAAIRSFIGIAMQLLNAGADVNAPAAPYEGRTALEGAAEWGRLDMVQLLLNIGAGTNDSGNARFGQAIELAEKEGHHAVAGLLKARLSD